MKVEGRGVTAAIVIVGGVTVVVGTLLPWMTLFGGLHAYRGIIGLYGRLIAGAGLVAITLGCVLAAREHPLLRVTAATLGLAIFSFSTILIRNMMSIVGSHRGDLMMIAAPGSGLYVCLAGAGLMSLSIVGIPRRSLEIGKAPFNGVSDAGR